MVLEESIDVAPALEERCRSAPAAGIGSTAVDSAEDLTGYGALGPKPYLDSRASPLGRVDSTALGVEVHSVGRGAVGEIATACVAGAGAIRRERCGVGGLGLVVDEASGAGVKGHCVLAVGVDTFDDVNLAVVWPVGPVCPEGWPRGADTSGHVSEV